MQKLRANHGNAFIIVLWMVAILGTLIASFSAIAISQLRVTDSLKHTGISNQMVESGLEIWSGLVSTDAEVAEPEGVVVTEIMNNFPYYIELEYPIDLPGEYPDDPPYSDNFIENQLFENWVDEYTPEDWDGSHSFDFGEGNWNQDPDNRMLGEYSVHVNGGGERDLDQHIHYLEEGTEYHGEVWVKGTGGATVRVAVRDGHAANYGWSDDEPLTSGEWKKITTTRTPTGTGDEGGLRIRTDDSEGEVYIGAAWLADKESPPAWPAESGEIDHNFIEVYNSGMGVDGDTPNLVSDNYEIEDSLDSQGTSVSNTYELKVHPEDYHDPGGWNYTDGELAYGQVGLIIPVGIDTGPEGLDIAGKIESEDIRLYTPWNATEDTHQFLTDGLHNEQMEQITLHRPTGWENDVVLPDVELPWDPSGVVENYSREKIDIMGENTNDNWEISEAEGGTPGRVAAGGGDWNAHHLTDWHWGGEIVNGVALGDTVYVPSLTAEFTEDEDFAYFRITRIHDESGKQDLNNPRKAECVELASDDYQYGCVLGEHTSDGRTMRSYSWAEDIITRNLEFLTTMDLMDIANIGPDVIDERKPSYSAYRLGESDRVNINTASWEALRGIQMAGPPVGGGDTHFITDELARKIIELRSGHDATQVGNDLPLTSGDYYPELSPEYVTDYADTFSSPTDVCPDLEDIENNFNCDVFSEYTMTKSEGLLYVEVIGGRLDNEGNPASKTELHAIVDRRPLRMGEPLEEVYKRIW